MQRYKLTIAYVGTRFSGWQRQAVTGRPEPRTVQHEMETLASHIAGQKVNIHASGRTDTGVHADAQVAHMDIPLSRTHVNWLRVFNTQLPPDIAITSIEPVPDTFHAQYSAVSKLYAYTLWLNPEYIPPKLRPFVWGCGPVNLELMQEAAKHLVGTHDFASMRNVGVEYTTTVRTISKAEMLPQDPASPLIAVWHFEADGFLKQMVRNMMGMLVNVGKGKLKPSDVAEILEAKERTLRAPTAPASGLTLVRVNY